MLRSESLEFLRRLCDAFGPSGFEREPGLILKDYVTPFCDRVTTDKLGSVLFSKRGSSDGPVVLLPGHIDEVGFVVAGISKEGFLSFATVGGWFDQVLLAQRVTVRTAKGMLPGVVSSKPPHILTPEERDKVVKHDKMFIDIGASSKDEAVEMGARVGDPVVPDSKFTTIEKPLMENGTVKGTTTLAMGKAFDDRIGAFVAAEVIRRLTTERLDHPNTVVGAGTVQEEVGLRGARTAAWMANPDVCLTLEVDISQDIPGVDPDRALVIMGKGPSVLTYDSSMVPNQALKDLVIQTAAERSIPYQLSLMARGGTDAGMIHVTRVGCPSVVLGVPTRHIHSHVGILSLEDVTHLVDLVVAVVQKLDHATVTGLTAL
ncbi:M42 family metallopeptidase [Candidatus Fermentibacteria bacterium]|nr:M42 family metallopeptidase [Candidatus Fermentibacteria bacterium]